MLIVRFYTVNGGQRRDHDLFGGRAGNDAYADLPVESERFDCRFDEPAETGGVAL